MRKLKFLYFLILVCFSACISSEENSLNGIDTAKIMHLIFENNLFVNENLKKNSDTLYILKSIYINDSWPKKTKHFNLKYIDSTSRATIVNFGPNSPYDGRSRLSVLKFYHNKDSVNVLILSHGDQIFFICSLKLIDRNNWKILETRLDDVGRRAKYEFEDEQWYIDLKKKIKPHRPIFPPPEPKDN